MHIYSFASSIIALWNLTSKRRRLLKKKPTMLNSISQDSPDMRIPARQGNNNDNTPVRDEE